MATSFTLNGKTVSGTAEPDTPLLWVMRDEIGLTGTKFGCGMALCGACTVHLDGSRSAPARRRCSVVAGKKVTTIEALSKDNSHPLQKAWIAHDVPQCGYCQSGQIMSAAALLQHEHEAERRRHRRRHERQYLPLRHLPAHPRRDPHGGRGNAQSLRSAP